MLIRLTVPVLCVLGSFVGTGSAQSLLPGASAEPPLVERLSLDVRAHSLLSGRTFGAFGSASLSFPVAHIPSAARNVLFGHDISVSPTVGMGSIYGGRFVRTPVPYQFIEAGVTVPVVDLSAVIRSERLWTMTVTPSLGVSLMRDGVSQSHRFITFHGASLGTVLRLWYGVSLVAETRWTFFHSPRIIRLQTFPSFGLGLSFALGSGPDKQNQYLRMAESILLKTSERMTSLEDSVDLLRAYLQLAQSGPGVTDKRAVEEELRVIRSEVREMRSAVDKMSRTMDDRIASSSLASLSSFRTDDQVDRYYDPERLPPTALIRIEKRLFEGEDLVEEMYLKSVLAILNSYDNYVWEVVYRDQTTRDGAAGSVLARRVCQFFELYNARLSQKLTIRHDDGIRPEFEVRCLGLAK